MHRRKSADEPTLSFTVCVSVRSGNAFIQWCHDEWISYLEGFDRLIAMLRQEEP